MANPTNVLRANEIVEYMYCHRAWWMHRAVGMAPENPSAMEMGLARHMAHGRQIAQAEMMRRFAVIFVGLAAFFATLCVFAMILSTE